MSKRHQYVDLLASLPALPVTPFGREPLPISAIRLEHRLVTLSDAHRDTLEALESLLDWRHLGLELSTEAYIRCYRQAAPQLAEHGVLELVEALLEQRSLMTALRRRRRGDPAPSLGETWGFGPRLAHISAHWQAPLFGVGPVFPWLAEAREHLEHDRPRKLEGLLLEEGWRRLDRARRHDRFDFREVVIYWLRWRLLAAWRRYNAEAAERRLQADIEQGLGDYETLFSGDGN
ncbi:hypothetical protein SAMN02745148_00149 [Modicisalibacter ilicicola DSM 19980]|uniref:Uncharacterized protein n=1 Tax=Modicisalibacter ilicicola DSM 19980 TaxID=1121942 RepID=A0A1M4SKT4_9GAMM|nr:hypothetical protein [Halomonas ilicicola]SHE32853.1 hypothetical protein SAMN02745148_00149 [Halomonas ilicicola DSM 19980]